uniref:Uncharacterized protein n=1 Tax=Anopheles stephensi TaxID=30069 RepID=A0A182YKX2_ANOST
MEMKCLTTFTDTQSQATPSSPEACLQTASSSEDISSMNDSPVINVIAKTEPTALLTNGYAGNTMDTALKTNGPARACIMTALSIDTKSNQDPTVALKMVSSSMGITLTNGAAVTAVTQ